MLKIVNPLATGTARIQQVFASFEDEVLELEKGVKEINEEEAKLNAQINDIEAKKMALLATRTQALSLKSRLQELLGA